MNVKTEILSDQTKQSQTQMMQISPTDDPDRPWEPWKDMPVGDQRNIVREVLSQDGRTALAYFTGKFMALAPISKDPEPLPFKVWMQRRPHSPAPQAKTEGICPTCDGTGKEGRHSICRDCDETSPPQNHVAGDDLPSLHSETTPEGGVIRLSKWPEGYVLWYHGKIVWRSWVNEAQQISHLRVTGFRGNPLRVVLSSGDEASVSQKLIDSFASPSPFDQHPDDLAVDRFAAAMKSKLAKKRDEGRGGWDDPEQCHIDYLVSLLMEQIHERAALDPVDIANLSMMIHERGETPNHGR